MDAADWKCPICMDLVYKPTVNACGHVFCFWCFHHAMSPWSPSSCPMCRATYAHLPAPCGLLHHFLRVQLPEEYEARRRETAAEEEQQQTPSPEPPAPAALPTTPGAWQQSHFNCHSPHCGRLLHQPTVLNCGHVVCKACCTSSGAACPACQMPQPGAAPAVCMQLQAVLQQLFPAAQANRAAEAAAAQTAQPAEPAAVDAGGRKASIAEAAEPSSEAAVTPTERQQQQGGPSAVASPSLAAAVEQGQQRGGGPAALAGSLGRSARQLAEEEYVHHGIGCDACGHYPIVGRRYTCRDCSHSMGFDLCGPCMDRGVSELQGRFAQHHRAEHRVELVRPRLTAMHLLQACNPELPPEQLLWMLEMALERGQEEEEEGVGEHGQQGGQAGDGGELSLRGGQPLEPAGSPGSQHEQLQQQQAEDDPHQQQQAELADEQQADHLVGEQQQQEAQQQPEEGSDRPIPLLRPRGPRPAPDPTASWPSPSAMS